MEFNRKLRGAHVCFQPEGDFSAGQIVRLKSSMTDDIKDKELDIAIDLSKVLQLDVTGIRFFNNLEKALKRNNKKLVFFGGEDKLRELLKENKGFVIYPNLMEFERSFHEISDVVLDTYFEISKGAGDIRHLDLICPLCEYETVKGFLFDTTHYYMDWSKESITPVMLRHENPENQIDFDLYQVAVCPECFFASSRIDWFCVNLEEGYVESVLKTEEKERLVNTSAQRKNVLSSFGDTSSKANFWALPRESYAGYLSWKLNEETLRYAAKDRVGTDGFEIAYSNFMMCKFSRKESMVDEHLSTAQAWLHSILSNTDRYSTFRIAKAYTFSISVDLAMDKGREARKSMIDFEKGFKSYPEYAPWLERSLELVAEHEAELNGPH